eukprot:356666-Chlamydomonas_euryale.AAC.7
MDTLQHTHDALAVAFRPDGKQLAVSTLDGCITLWDPQVCVRACVCGHARARACVRMRVCVCMRACMHACMHAGVRAGGWAATCVRVCACLRACVRACVCARARVRVRTGVHACAGGLACVCGQAGARVRVRVRVWAHVHVRVRACVCVRARVRACACACVRMRACACVLACAHAYACVCARVCVRACVRALVGCTAVGVGWGGRGKGISCWHCRLTAASGSWTGRCVGWCFSCGGLGWVWAGTKQLAVSVAASRCGDYLKCARKLCEGSESHDQGRKGGGLGAEVAVDGGMNSHHKLAVKRLRSQSQGQQRTKPISDAARQRCYMCEDTSFVPAPAPHLRL